MNHSYKIISILLGISLSTAILAKPGDKAREMKERAQEAREKARRDSFKREREIKIAEKERVEKQIAVNKYVGAVQANGGVAPKWAEKTAGAAIYKDLNKKFQASINQANAQVATLGASTGMNAEQVKKLQAEMKKDIQAGGKITPAASVALTKAAAYKPAPPPAPKTNKYDNYSNDNFNDSWKGPLPSQAKVDALKAKYSQTQLSSVGPSLNYMPPPAASNGQPNYFGHPAGSENALKTDPFNKCFTEGAKCKINLFGLKLNSPLDSDSLNKIRLLQGTSVFHDNYLQDKDYLSTDSGVSAMVPSAVASFLYTAQTGKAVPASNETANRQAGPVGFQGSSAYTSDANFAQLEKDLNKWMNQTDYGIAALTNPTPGKDKLKVQLSGAAALLNVAGDMSQEIIKVQVQNTTQKLENKVEGIVSWLTTPVTNAQAQNTTQQPVITPVRAPRAPMVPVIKVVTTATPVPVGDDYVPNIVPTSTPAP